MSKLPIKLHVISELDEINQLIIPLKALADRERAAIYGLTGMVYKRARNNAIVEYDGNRYQRRFSPLKLSKSGKVVSKWARYWFLQSPNGKVDTEWEYQVREIWPTYFLIRTIDL